MLFWGVIWQEPDFNNSPFYNCSRRHDCHGLGKWQHLSVPGDPRWIHVQKTEQDSWNAADTAFGLESGRFLPANRYAGL